MKRRPPRSTLTYTLVPYTTPFRSTPVSLFIDEIDSFGDRNSFSHDNRDYSIQVVNAFLELLDGIQSREGVVVVGATNNPDRIDPAIKRSGRLDRIITEIGRAHV